MRMLVIKAAFCCLSGIAWFNSRAQDGSPDPGFGTNGVVTGSVQGASAVKITDIAIQADGKIVAAGFYNAGSEFNPSYQMLVMRFSAEGAPDLNFNSTGYTTIPFGANAVAQAFAVAVQSNGQIVVGGTVYNNGNTDFALARLNAGGTVDQAFGANGIVTTDFGSRFTEEIHDLIVQKDGKLVAVGQGASVSGNIAMARYNTDGSLDDSFGAHGKVSTALFADFSHNASSVDLQTDGRLIVGASVGGIDNSEAVILRYNTNGTLDGSFHGSGYNVFAPYQLTAATSVKVLSDGSIVAGGSYYNPNGGGNGMFLLKLSTSGDFDNGFGTAGKLLYPSASANAVALQNDGKIIAAGSRFGDLSLARFTVAGTLDPAFGNNGLATADVHAGSDDVINALLLQKDGKLVSAGYSGQQLLLARHLSSSATLPVMLQNWNLILDKSKVLLRWQAAADPDLKEFQIQRKVAQEPFITIGTVTAIDNSGRAVQYRYTDETAELYRGKRLDYRLLIVGSRGENTISEVRSIKMPQGISDLLILPNPVKSSLVLRFRSAARSRVKLQIFDQAGRLSLSKDITVESGMSELRTDIGNLKSGLYGVLLRNETEVFRTSLLKE